MKEDRRGDDSRLGLFLLRQRESQAATAAGRPRWQISACATSIAVLWGGVCLVQAEVDKGGLHLCFVKGHKAQQASAAWEKMLRAGRSTASRQQPPPPLAHFCARGREAGEGQGHRSVGFPRRPRSFLLLSTKRERECGGFGRLCGCPWLPDGDGYRKRLVW